MMTTTTLMKLCLASFIGSYAPVHPYAANLVRAQLVSRIAQHQRSTPGLVLRVPLYEGRGYWIRAGADPAGLADIVIRDPVRDGHPGDPLIYARITF